MGLSPESAELFATYFHWTLLALPAIMCEQVVGAALRAAGDTISVMVAMIAMNVVNLLVSYGLVTGYGPFPELGWRGIAIGTATGYYVGALVMLIRLYFGPSGLRVGFRTAWTYDDARRLLKVGIPGGIDILTLIGCQLLFVRLINGLGTTATAAHGIAIRVESLSYLPAFAFQIAATTMVGQFLGARRPDLAKRSVWIACAIGEAFVIVCASLLFHFSDRLTALFFQDGANPEVAALAARVLRVVCVVQPGLVILMILTGALRGAGDTRWPLLNTLVGFLVIRIPLGYVLAYRGIDIPGLIVFAPLGLLGAWYAMAIDLCFRTALITLRFRGGRWSRIVV
ncbi:MAG: MATE family efflux transporter [Pirellulales bacterium]